MATLTITLDADVKAELDALAAQQGIPAEDLAKAALLNKLRYERYVQASIDRGLADVEAGRTYEEAEIESLLARLEDEEQPAES